MTRSKRWLLAGLCLLTVVAASALWWLPARRHVTGPELRAAYHKAAQRLYRHELLSLYQPPEEAFTPHGLQLLRHIQGLYSPVFLPYLVMGSVPVQPDVLYNPWFDLFILIEDVDGQINSILLASARSPEQTPQLAVQDRFWQEVYRRYQAVQLASFSSPRSFDETPRAIAELRNLTNQCGWPARVQLPSVGVAFDLYIQRPAQAIYCSPIEPGTFVVFNYHGNRLHTNVIALPPYTARQMEKVIGKTTKSRPGQEHRN